MKKFLIRSLFLLLALAAGCGLFLWHEGKEAAVQLENGISLEEAVRQAQSNPDYVQYQDLPPFLLQATVSIEDRRFYEHGGVDVIGLGRAVLSQFLPDMVRSGGSTISQQVVKNLYGRFDTNLRQKLAEIVLAEKLNEMMGKNEILALYVNIINYGDDYTGINEASWGYFDKAPLYMSPGQCAILAGIPNSPANLQLSDHYDQAREREKLVLQAMVEAKYITEQQAQNVFNTGELEVYE